ncbi:ER lumen protein retaining receptor-domain-containing protein [Pelagophyceae sp. CCMP2097]|nr:ER lumen protein retaining receptor-domain-containing protein [Pelagophyceae sp. CCMP2097]|mmetsp:Transcript_9806/g.33848  ORF Transcript_9806/g.33848 Transcript_9806/m.33848 type:complete len:222 (+) Transcript_9806:81-746(+)
MLNFFRLAGDMAHVCSIVILILRLRVSKSAVGISLKTQELFLLVFVTRYLDLFTTYYSIYNSCMKVAYIASTTYIIYLIRFKEPFRSKYDKSQDSFLHLKFAVAPCAALAILLCAVKRELAPIDMLWTFSILLEALAIVPQLFVLQRYREVENLTGHYVFFLGAYRGLYILNWVYRSYYEPFYRHNWIVYVSGAAQTALYIDFFYYYVVSKYYGGKLTLPT